MPSVSRTRLIIGCVGDQFLPGVRESLGRAVECCNIHGLMVTVKIQPPITILPFFGLATMRNRLCMMALEERADYIVLLDNDVRLDQPYIFCQLVTQSRPIIVPRLKPAYKTKAKIMEPDSGHASHCHPIDWAVLSCIMFHRSFLQQVRWPFADTFCYLEEETTFQRWKALGSTAYRDPASTATLLRPPTNLWELKPQDLFRIKTPGDVAKGAIR